jgi:hypothetical protein
MRIGALDAQDERAPEAFFVCEELPEALEEFARFDGSSSVVVPSIVIRIRVVVIVLVRRSCEPLLIQCNERIARLHPQMRPCVARLPCRWVQQQQV